MVLKYIKIRALAVLHTKRRPKSCQHSFKQIWAASWGLNGSSYRDRRQHPSLRQVPGRPWGDLLCAVQGERARAPTQQASPSPIDTRAAPLAFWSAFHRAAMMGMEEGNNHLYRHNILLQKVPELSPWSKNLTENRFLKVLLTPLRIWCTQSSQLDKTLNANYCQQSLTCCGPLQEKLAI